MMRLAPALLLALGAPFGALAQVISEPLRGAEIISEAARVDEKREGSARFFDPEDGQFDLSYFLENPRGFLPIPIVVTEPAVGYGGGAAGMFLRPRREAGDEGWARPDISAVGAFGTQNGTWGAFAGDASRWLDGRLRTLLGAGAGQFNLDFFGLGTAPSSLDQGVRYSLQFTGVLAQANWQLAPKSPWAVRPALRLRRRGPKATRPRVSGPRRTGPGEDLGANCHCRVRHARQHLHAYPWNLCRILLARLAQSLGASDDFERFQQVLIGWHPLAEDVTLGARANYAWSSDGTPFFLRPFVQLRGVPAVRYQGDQAASIEVEATLAVLRTLERRCLWRRRRDSNQSANIHHYAEHRQRRLRLPLRAGKQVRDARRHRCGAQPWDDRRVFCRGQRLVSALAT